MAAMYICFTACATAGDVHTQYECFGNGQTQNDERLQAISEHETMVREGNRFHVHIDMCTTADFPEM